MYDAMKADVLSTVLTLVDGYRYRTADDSDKSDLNVRTIQYIDGVGTDNPADPFDKSSHSTPLLASTVFDTDYFDKFEPQLLTNTIQHYQECQQPRQGQKTMDGLTSSFEKTNAELEELDAAESEEAGNQLG